MEEREKARVQETWNCKGSEGPDYEGPLMLLPKVEAVFCR